MNKSSCILLFGKDYGNAGDWFQWFDKGSLRSTYMAEHTLWQHYVRVPCANAAYLFTQLDLKRIGRSQEMFSLHWWGSPHIVVRSEAEACHGHGRAPLRQHSITSSILSIKDLDFLLAECAPAIQSCADYTSFAKNNSEINLVLRGSCVDSLFYCLALKCQVCNTVTALSHTCVKQHSQESFILSSIGN